MLYYQKEELFDMYAKYKSSDKCLHYGNFSIFQPQPHWPALPRHMTAGRNIMKNGLSKEYSILQNRTPNTKMNLLYSETNLLSNN